MRVDRSFVSPVPLKLADGPQGTAPPSGQVFLEGRPYPLHVGRAFETRLALSAAWTEGAKKLDLEGWPQSKGDVSGVFFRDGPPAHREDGYSFTELLGGERRRANAISAALQRGPVLYVELGGMQARSARRLALHFAKDIQADRLRILVTNLAFMPPRVERGAEGVFGLVQPGLNISPEHLQLIGETQDLVRFVCADSGGWSAAVVAEGGTRLVVASEANVVMHSEVPEVMLDDVGRALGDQGLFIMGSKGPSGLEKSPLYSERMSGFGAGVQNLEQHGLNTVRLPAKAYWRVFASDPALAAPLFDPPRG